MQLAVLINPQIDQKIESLYQGFLKLDAQEQAVLVVLAVIHKPIGISKLDSVLEILHKQGYLPYPRKDYRLSPQQRERLARQTFLIVSKEGLQLNRLLSNVLTLALDSFDNLFDFAALDNGNKLSAMLKHKKLMAILDAAEAVVPVLNSNSWQNKEIDERRLIRDLYYLDQIDQFEAALAFNKNPQVINHARNSILVEILFLPFNKARFLRLSHTLQYQALATLIRTFQMQGQSCEYPVILLEQICAEHKTDADTQESVSSIAACRHLLAEQFLYQMRFDDLEHVLSEEDNSTYALQLQGAFSFIQGKNQAALAYFEQALVARNKIIRRKKQYLNDVLGHFYKLALIVEANQRDVNYFSVALQQITFEENDRKIPSSFYTLGQTLARLITCLSTAEKYDARIDYIAPPEKYDFFCHQLNYVNYLLAQVWCNQSKENEHAILAKHYQAKFEQLHYPLFARFCEQMAASFNNNTATLDSTLADITTFIKTRSKWDVALDKLIALNPQAQSKAEAEKETVAKPVRLIWELNQGYETSLSAREQKLNKAGWSKGRSVSLKRLKKEMDSFDYLNESDKALCRTITAYEGWGYYSKTEYELKGLSALLAAVGIDNLYADGDLSAPIELIQREPELLVSQQGDELCLSIADYECGSDGYEVPSGQAHSTYKLQPISDSQYQLTVFSQDHIKVANIIGEGGLLIPMSAKQKALEGISAIAPFLNIQSDIHELDTGLETHVCDQNLVVNIEPTQTGLMFTCLVMPFGEKGPAFKPSIGNASLSTEINGKRIATQRDLLREEAQMEALEVVCPAFFNMRDYSLNVEDFQSALATLEQLEAATTQDTLDLVLRWPKGKKIKLSKKLGSEHLQLAVGKKSEWFDITGNLQVDKEQVIELRKLLELVNTSNGRFIALGANQILALSDDLREKLEQINQVTDDGKFHALASLQIEEATTGMRMKTIHAWDAQTAKMHQANAINPQIPSTFQAQLRDYQLVGFDWAMRLAHWGAGACLADDMGLGKTLQALAILVARGKQGPSLVVAPTSVCFNWQQEAFKFAPTLHIKLFADSTSTIQREDLLNNLSPLDCVIISYGLLQRETEILKAVHWHTIVADEAQALKNPLAKRTKAAYALQGDFKLITTGTPIENDLTELWSLFRFINPGLLGNIKRFGKLFAFPIENAEEDRLAARKASQGLRALIQPFILRRMKNQVLTELPSRTEINIQVEMSDKEHAFYEALRLNAIDNISQSSQHANPGEQRIRMLAELVKLRQACCNPKLVIAETNIPSAKLAALQELLEELKLNNHKALIFSQFVGHLQLIKQHLEAQGFSYQYLDGSTPQKERQKRVNAFQNGDGDIFLISLKAGGSGLNLTAADYVIHMDPWWNPAVEQQASDRAHRMGQTRPVTIYRLITQNTIEERIVALHQHKRDLADQLLSGNDAVTKLSVDDMLNLLKETF